MARAVPRASACAEPSCALVPRACPLCLPQKGGGGGGGANPCRAPVLSTFKDIDDFDVPIPHFK